jgi:hypothetical protein
LSRDPKYAEISRRGMVELFSRRNKKTDLFGAHIDTKTGSWTEAHSPAEYESVMDFPGPIRTAFYA